MDQFITLLILFILIGLVDRFLKAAQKAKPQAPPEAESEAEEGTTVEGLPRALQDLIAEELGLNMERRPKVDPRARPAAPADAARARIPSSARRPRESRPRTVDHPGRREVERERGAPVSLEAARRPEERPRLRDRWVRPERRRPPRRRVPLPEPLGWSAAQKAIVWAELLGPPKGLVD